MYVWKDLIIQETTHLQQSRVIYELSYACFSLCLLTLKCNLWLRHKRCLPIHMYHKQMYSFVLLDLRSSFGTGKQCSESLLPSFPLLDMGCLSAELFSRSHLFARGGSSSHGTIFSVGVTQCARNLVDFLKRELCNMLQMVYNRQAHQSCCRGEYVCIKLLSLLCVWAKISILWLC